MSKAVIGRDVPISCHQGCSESYLKIALCTQSPEKLDKILAWQKGSHRKFSDEFSKALHIKTNKTPFPVFHGKEIKGKVK